MGALHDGSRFLIQDYAIAVTPGLNLTDPKPVRRDRMRVLALGLTESVQDFPGLPYVSGEIQAIHQLYGGLSLLDRDFVVARVGEELRREPFNVLHIASHGHFGKDVEETFVLAFDARLTVDRLSDCVGLFRFREEPLDLLTLSACETAAGDDRAALGLAGIAVRAGARSALATLWHVSDPASYRLVVEFYRRLRDPGVSRASALQSAQLALLKDPRYDHPCYWAPFLLINNWL
jgi:CHAT domain-containing protein